MVVFKLISRLAAVPIRCDHRLPMDLSLESPFKLINWFANNLKYYGMDSRYQLLSGLAGVIITIKDPPSGTEWPHLFVMWQTIIIHYYSFKIIILGGWRKVCMADGIVMMMGHPGVNGIRHDIDHWANRISCGGWARTTERYIVSINVCWGVGNEWASSTISAWPN